jgi:hypothetical protein
MGEALDSFWHLCCLGAGFFYQQAPRRDMTRKLEVKAVDAEKEELLLTREEEGKGTAHK